MNRLFIVHHGLRDYHSHYYGETRGWFAACRARGLEPIFFINRHAETSIVQEFAARPTFPFAADVIVERDRECQQLSDFLRLSSRFADAARSLEADGVGPDDLVLLPFSTERDIFGAAIWLQRLAPARRPTMAFVFYGPDLRWEVDADRREVHGDVSYFRYAMKRLSAVLPAEKILIFAVDQRLCGVLARAMGHPCLEIPLATHYFEEAQLGVGDAPSHAHIRVVGEFRPEKGSELVCQVIVEFGNRRPGRTLSIQANDKAGADALVEIFRRASCRAKVEVHYGRLDGHMRHDAYLGRLIASDIILLPYFWRRYAMRSSGVFSEAVGFGLVSVVPDRTWMADKLSAGFGAGTIFGSFNVPSITEALVQASDDFPALKEKALASRKNWRQSQSTLAALDTILGHLARSRSAAPPPLSSP